MLEKPHELLELEDGESLAFRVTKWQREETIIRPPHAPQGKAVDVLRVFVPEGDKQFPPFYYDITSARAIALLLPYLGKPGFEQRTFKLTKHGVKPTAHFTLEVT